MKITLPLPPTTNQTYKVGNGRMYKSKEATDWRKDAFFEIKKDVKHERFGKKRVEVFVDIYYVREPDIDGCIKTIYDLLQETMIIDNDKQIDDAHQHKERVKSTPHVVITIQEIK